MENLADKLEFFQDFLNSQQGKQEKVLNNWSLT